MCYTYVIYIVLTNYLQYIYNCISTEPALDATVAPGKDNSSATERGESIVVDQTTTVGRRGEVGKAPGDLPHTTRCDHEPTPRLGVVHLSLSGWVIPEGGPVRAPSDRHSRRLQRGNARCADTTDLVQVRAFKIKNLLLI